jgi:hypothetical protein
MFHIFFYIHDSFYFEKVLDSIIKICNNLKSITFNFNRISDELIENFGLKFRQKLREINFINAYKTDDINKYKKLLRLCPNLVSLGDKYIVDLSLFVDSNELLVPKLSRISTEVESKNIQLFENFAKNYENSLKKSFNSTRFWFKR